MAAAETTDPIFTQRRNSQVQLKAKNEQLLVEKKAREEVRVIVGMCTGYRRPYPLLQSC
jgi:hypothetical protein